MVTLYDVRTINKEKRRWFHLHITEFILEASGLTINDLQHPAGLTTNCGIRVIHAMTILKQ